MVDEDCKTSYSTVPFQQTGYFSKTICDYLDKKATLRPFYNNFPDIPGFKKQIEEKRMSVQTHSRTTLVKSLKNQYKNLHASDKVKKNINLLQEENTFTVTTGHQLNLFTGPLYFLYKIVSAINLAKELKTKFPSDNFVPIYWMASEDHDFDEINYFNLNGKKISWNRESSGGVGRLTTEGLSEVLKVFSKEIGLTTNAGFLKDLFNKGYVEHTTLTEATRYIANKLFEDYGLVIIDGDDIELKKLFAPFVEDELLNQTSYQKVSETINKLETNYKIQVNPREINLFYLNEGLRDRMIYEDNVFKVNETDIEFSKDELAYELKLHPERFSPNALLRPLYQEVILPNLCYIGGGGEMIYWLQLKSNFEAQQVTFPMLLLRNSALVKTTKQTDKLEKLNISDKDLFLNRNSFINKKVRKISNIDVDFSEQIKYLEQQFEALYKLAEQTDKSFLGAVKAQEVKQIKGLKDLEKRLLKAQKKKLADQISRCTELQEQLFPGQSLQERNTNFSELYLEYGDDLIPELLKSLEPLKGAFLILNLE